MTRWGRFLVEAHSLEPLVMTSGEQSRNRIGTLPYVTGSSLRGALAARWLRGKGYYPAPGEDPVPIPDSGDRRAFLEFFESGAVRFPCLFRKPLPPPLSLRECKVDPRHDLLDLADPRQRVVDKPACPTCGEPVDRAHGSGLPAPTVRTRTAVSDARMAATAMLYAQEELDEGQYFSGVLHVRPDLAEQLDRWAPIEDAFRVSVGADRSTSGLVELVITPSRDYGVPLAQRRDAWPSPDEIVMSARSAVALTDPWLRPAQRFEAATLASLLGVCAVRLTHTWERVRDVAGWNPAAGLPKHTDTMLSEGSVAVLEVVGEHDPDALLARIERLEVEGIGWRRAEGYGDVRFWDPRHLDPVGGL